MAIEHAEIVLEQGDLARAPPLWIALLRNDPDNVMLRVRAGEVSHRLALWRAESEQPFPVDGNDDPSGRGETLALVRQDQEHPVADASSELRAFFMGFKSLGHSCDFGPLQRHFGAEPIGLFRWNSIHAPRLLEVVTAQLEGIDDPDNLLLETSGGEYVLRDSRY